MTSRDVGMLQSVKILEEKTTADQVKTRPCTTVRDSEDILEQSSFQKYTA